MKESQDIPNRGNLRVEGGMGREGEDKGGRSNGFLAFGTGQWGYAKRYHMFIAVARKCPIMKIKYENALIK